MLRLMNGILPRPWVWLQRLPGPPDVALFVCLVWFLSEEVQYPEGPFRLPIWHWDPKTIPYMVLGP